MFETVMHSSKLLISGKLFKDNKAVARQTAIGAAAGAVALVIAAQFAPLWFAALIGGAVAGGLQPYLFKDLKFA